MKAHPYEKQKPGARAGTGIRAFSDVHCTPEIALFNVMRLPNADRAVVDISKLRDYCLNPDHPWGRHKARVFASVLGLTRDDADVLREAVLSAAVKSDAQKTEEDNYGQRYILDFRMVGPAGEALVRTSWIVLKGEAVPRLTTCYVL